MMGSFLAFNGSIFADAAAAASAESGASHFIDKWDGFVDHLGPEFNVVDDPIKVELGGQVRYRFEFRDDFNFNNAAFEDDGFSLLRTRLNAKVHLGDNIELFAEGQDAESFAARAAHKAGIFANQLDLHQLYAKVDSPWENLNASVKVGRQKLSYGDQRLVGAFEWSNTARVFDAVKLELTPSEKLKIDAWFSQVVAVNKKKPDSPTHKDNFYGIYTVLKPAKGHVLDTYIFLRDSRDQVFASERAGKMGPRTEYTIGNRYNGEWKGFDFGYEGAWQFGVRGHDAIMAYALHFQLGYTFEEIAGSPHLLAAYNHGSGDSDPTDGKFKNFDNLFPTNHLFYGYMDLANWSNMNNFKFQLDFNGPKKTKFIAAYHMFFLDTNNSAWTNAGGGAIRGPNSGAGTTVGQELDLVAKWKVGKHLSFLTGYSHFFAGDFISDTGADNDADFLYFQSVLTI